jgi:hypothetical protein
MGPNVMKYRDGTYVMPLPIYKETEGQRSEAVAFHYTELCLIITSHVQCGNEYEIFYRGLPLVFYP